MAFKGITYAGQNVTPKNDGGLYQAHYGDGILWGCSMNISGDDLVIQSGEFIMGGRVVQVDGATNVDLSGRTLQTGYIQVIMNADLSQGEGSQWYTTFVESATTTFPALTKDDINDTGTLYQIALAVVQISGGNLTNITSQMQNSMVTSKNTILAEGSGSGIAVELSENGVREITLSHTGSSNYFVAFNEAGTQASKGLVLADSDAGDAVLFNSGNIVFRPNGNASSVGQMYLDSSGALHGSLYQYYTANSQRFHVMGKMVHWYCAIIESTARMTAGQAVLLSTTIPSSYRPTADYIFPCVMISGNTVLGYGTISANTDGTLRIRSNTSYSGAFQVQAVGTWLIL